MKIHRVRTENLKNGSWLFFSRSHIAANYDIRVIYIKNNIDGCRVAESCPRMLVALKV